jgi:hypothetical protein
LATSQVARGKMKGRAPPAPNNRKGPKARPKAKPPACSQALNE